MFFIVHPYTQTLHSLGIILLLVFIQVHNPSDLNGSGKLLNNNILNKTRTNGTLFTVCLNRTGIYDYVLIPCTKNRYHLGCFST
jgi:hypothetical protein